MAGVGENAGGLMLDDLGHAADVGGDGGHAGQGRFDERHRHSLVVGGEQDEVSGRVNGLHIGPPAERKGGDVARIIGVEDEVSEAVQELAQLLGVT